MSSCVDSPAYPKTTLLTSRILIHLVDRVRIGWARWPIGARPSTKGKIHEHSSHSLRGVSRRIDYKRANRGRAARCESRRIALRGFRRPRSYHHLEQGDAMRFHLG